MLNLSEGTRKKIPVILSLLVMFILLFMADDMKYVNSEITEMSDNLGRNVIFYGYVTGIRVEDYGTRLKVSGNNITVSVYSDYLHELDIYDRVAVMGSVYEFAGRINVRVISPSGIRVVGKQNVTIHVVSEINAEPENFMGLDISVRGELTFPPADFSFTLSDGPSSIYVRTSGAVFSGCDLRKGTFVEVTGTVMYNWDRGRYEIHAALINGLSQNNYSATLKAVADNPSMWTGAEIYFSNMTIYGNQDEAFVSDHSFLGFSVNPEIFNISEFREFINSTINNGCNGTEEHSIPETELGDNGTCESSGNFSQDGKILFNFNFAVEMVGVPAYDKLTASYYITVKEIFKISYLNP